MIDRNVAQRWVRIVVKLDRWAIEVGRLVAERNPSKVPC